MKTQRCFTLVELLTVITIIAVLMGILMPVLAGAKEKARETQARTEIKALALAIKQFEATYGFLPFVAGSDLTSAGLGVESPVTLDDGLYTTLINCLQGRDDTRNPRGLKWIEVQKDKDNNFAPGRYRDPWNNNYWICLDLDYNGEIQGGDPNISGSDAECPYEPVYGTMAIWSMGPDGNRSRDADAIPAGAQDAGKFDKVKNKDDINGWETSH